MLILLLAIFSHATFAFSQMPFYTDNAEVTTPGKWHFEFFDEFDGLQSALYPDLRQNTANFRLNYGLPWNLELDVDAHYISILRAATVQSAVGAGDTDMGVKWNFRRTRGGSRSPGLSTSLYIEFPSGSVRNQLGSGLTD